MRREPTTRTEPTHKMLDLGLENQVLHLKTSDQNERTLSQENTKIQGQFLYVSHQLRLPKSPG